jgi:hypothetical protein
VDRLDLSPVQERHTAATPQTRHGDVTLIVAAGDDAEPAPLV